jgi:hypothetical protein
MHMKRLIALDGQSRAFPGRKCARKQWTMMVGIFHAREENGKKSDPRVRFLVRECECRNEGRYSPGAALINIMLSCLPV